MFAEVFVTFYTLTNMYACMYSYKDLSVMLVHHLVQTAHDNSLVLSYGGQGSDPHLPSTK